MFNSKFLIYFFLLRVDTRKNVCKDRNISLRVKYPYFIYGETVLQSFPHVFPYSFCVDYFGYFLNLNIWMQETELLILLFPRNKKELWSAEQKAALLLRCWIHCLGTASPSCPQSYFQQLTVQRKFSCGWKPLCSPLVTAFIWQLLSRYSWKDRM